MKPLKYYLWKHGLLGTRCPYCRKQMIEHGFEGENLRWSCPDDACRFNSLKRR